MSISKFLTLISIVTLIFLFFQLTFVNYIKSFYNSDYFLNQHINPRFNLFNLNTDTKQIETTFDNENKMENSDKKYFAQIQIPMENFGSQPKLLYILPFYHKKNMLSLETTLVEDTSYFNNSITQLYDQKLFRGINKLKLKLYQPDSDGNFKCLNSNQKISYKKLNDDFCDCVDATDEPGTSACQFSIFYCSIQNEYLQSHFIPSSQVDDKICDCCDGSDENHLKCPNRCEELVNKAKDDLRVKQIGINEKQKYLVDGIFKNENLYGPKGVFYRLSQKCLNINWAEYIFEVCPYKRISQFKAYKNKGLKRNLGTDSVLILGEILNQKIWILKMGNGDREFCSQPRESEIRFICGLKDSIKSVVEPQKCVYIFEYLTPAAC